MKANEESSRCPPFLRNKGNKPCLSILYSISLSQLTFKTFAYMRYIQLIHVISKRRRRKYPILLAALAALRIRLRVYELKMPLEKG